MAYQYDEGALFGGNATLDLVDAVLRFLGFAPADYNRYTKANIVRALNESQNLFAYQTGILTVPVIIVCMASRQNYQLPPNIIKVNGGRYYSGTGATEYDELILLGSMDEMQRKDSTFRGSTGDPDYLFPSYRTGGAVQIGISPYPSSDGTAFNYATWGVIESSTGWQFAGTITGAMKTGSSGAYLIDNGGRNLVTLGAQPGQMIYNTGSGNSAIISKITDSAATNDAAYGTLSNAGAWASADPFVIYLSEYAMVLSPKLNQITTVQSLYGSVADIIPQAGNLVLDCVRKPLPLTSSIDSFICEIPSQYQDGIVGGAVWRLGRGAHKGSRQLDKAHEGLAIYQAAVEECKGFAVVERSVNEIEQIDIY